MVTDIRVTASRLAQKIREAASSSSNVVFIPPPNKDSMAGMMTFQQAMSCLRDGSIVGKPQLNEHGDWELRMERYAANFLFTARVIAHCEGAIVSKIYIFIDAE